MHATVLKRELINCGHGANTALQSCVCTDVTQKNPQVQSFSIRPFLGCCRQVEAEVVSKSMNKIHQTWEWPHREAL